MTETNALARELRASARLAGPLAAAQLATVGMAFTDTVMMGRLGADALAGGALGASCFTTLLVIGGGVLAPVAPLVAEARGRDDEAGAAQAVRGGCAVAAVLGVLGTAALLGVAPLLPGLGQDPGAVEAARGYLNLIAPGFLPGLGLVVLRHALAAHGRAPVVVGATVGGALLNALADVALMRGAFGVPGLGLAGIGAASAIINWTMLAALAWYSRRLGVFGRRTRERGVTPTLMISIAKLGVPVAIMFGFEVGLFALTTLNVGRCGATWLAAHQIALQTTYITYVVPQGISQAAAVRVAHWMGSGRPVAARRAGLLAIGMGAAFMLATASGFWAFPRAIVAMYVSGGDPRNEALVEAATTLLAVAAAFQVFDGLQVTASGALRGLADARVPTLITASSYGLVAAPLSFAAGRRWGAPGCWGALVGGLALAAFGLTWRFARAARRSLTPASTPLPHSS